MGAQASKQVTRKLPKTARPETLTSTPRQSPATLQRQPDIDFKEEDLLKDLEKSNPQLLKNLAEIGPVTIPPTVTRMRKSDKMLGIIHERQRIEQEEEKDLETGQRINTDKLFTILDSRKHLPSKTTVLLTYDDNEKSKKEWEELGQQFKIDASKMKLLYKYYNTITVMPPSNPDDKDERRTGLWIENKEEWKKAVDQTQERHRLEKQLEEEKPTPEQDYKLTKEKEKLDQTLTEEERREKRLKNLFSD
ncbi:unnamed protein product [Cunninghamella blakesleeana]